MGVRNVDVDSQHLAEQLLRILRAVRRIVARATVSEANVEVPIGAERKVPAVVIRERLKDEGRTAGAAPAEIEARRRIRAYRIR